ncbi:MAG: PKD domain-containing protein, partial [Thermoplasmata archaeon]|nr:PKD domain-containing protein [Thermoplasmata archaeon]
TVPLLVSPPLTIQLNSTPRFADIGVPIDFTADITGGTPPLSVVWSFGDGGQVAVASSLHAYSMAGSFTARLNVSDGAGEAKNLSIPVTIAPKLSVSLSLTTYEWDATQNVMCRANLTGGTAPYVAEFSFGDGTPNVTVAPDASNGSAVVSHAWASVGPYTLSVHSSDGEESSNASRLVDIVPALRVSLVSSDPSPLAGSQVNFSVNTSGGVGPLSYAWSVLPGNFTGNGPVLSSTLDYPGSYSVHVVVTDRVGFVREANLTVVVQPPPSSAGPFLGGSTPLLIIAIVLLGGSIAGVAVYGRSRRIAASEPPEESDPAQELGPES